MPPAEPALAAKAQSAIVGGSYAEPSQWAFTAALFYRGRFGCGGSVVAPDKILTAAHCVAGQRAATISVVTGRPNLRQKAYGQVSSISGYKVHPSFRRRGGFDLAILTLTSPTPAAPVPLVDPVEAADATRLRKRLRVAGYGARNPFGFLLSARLRKTNEFVRRNRRCAFSYGRTYNGRKMICALGSRFRFSRFQHRSSCSGDSGGPLVADLDSGARLVGVVSFGGRICGDRSAPSVYVRVSAALDWIAPRI